MRTILDYIFCFIIKRLPQKLREQTRWIPCSERLPENGVPALLYYERNAWGHEGKFRKKDMDKGWQLSGMWHVDGCSGVVGIAWMPLPEPYEAEERGEDDGK